MAQKASGAGGVTYGMDFGHPPILKCTVSRLIQTHNVSATQCKVGSKHTTALVFLPFDDNLHNPCPPTGRINNKVKAFPITVPI